MSKTAETWFSKLHPWQRTLLQIRRRTNQNGYHNYHRYGGRGIKMLIGESELKALWFRDQAYLMKSPTIDRKDNDGHYSFNNCRYIERVENTRRMPRKNVCSKGHPLIGDNLRLQTPTKSHPWTSRVCRTCQSKMAADWYKRKKSSTFKQRNP